MKLHYFQHVAFEDLASLEEWAQARQHTLTVTRFYRNEPPPDVQSIDALIVLGGPMNIYEEENFPWLLDEKRCIREFIKTAKPVLGICLGAQLIADALGAKVYRNRHKEIGWLPIDLTEAALKLPLFQGVPERFTPFHWHGDTFDLPTDATPLATSAACKNQAFLYGEQVLALQFHLECNNAALAKMIAHESADMTVGEYVQSADEILAQENFYPETDKILVTICDRFFVESTD
ncbi:MAG: type 1 glutamine amidotransferase [Acidobacteria bacterium]|nr:type 1 glutamine amidotransferase [Acidobacteriota bacterium]